MTNTDIGEVSKVIESVDVVLEKYEGDEFLDNGDPNPDRVLLERIHLIDDELVSHDYFDTDGNIIKTEGGN